MTTTIGGSYPAVNSDSDATINGLTVGKGGGAVASNVVFGANALTSNTSGAYNTALGTYSLTLNTTGQVNTAVGGALYGNTTGSYNVGVGYGCLLSNTTASNNTAVGYQAGYSNTTGTTIDAFGYRALFSNTTGVYNSAFGGTDSASNSALYANTTGLANSAFAQGSLGKNTTGSYNSAFGYQALLSNTTASANTAVGYQAAYSNTTNATIDAFGYRSLYNSTGTNNVAFGCQSLTSTTSGSSNVAMGAQSLYSNTTASNNTAVGYQAGYTNSSTGASCTFLGYQAGYYSNAIQNTIIGASAGLLTTSGNYNTFLGSSAGYNITTGSKNTIVGRYDGNFGGLDIRTSSNYIVLSDGDGNPRYICNNSGQTFINATTPIVSSSLDNLQLLCTAPSGGNQYGMMIGGNGTSYTVNAMRFVNTYTPAVVGSITIGSSSTAYNTSSDYRLKENIAPMTGALDKVAQLKPVTYTWKESGVEAQGFIAHELQAVVPDCVTGEKDGVDAEGNPQYQGIDTSFLVATLTAAIQELKAEFDAYKATHP